jgi:N-acetyl sugar amidotransferase
VRPTKRCTRCILPESFHGIEFDEQGVCNYCRFYDKKWKDFDYKAAEKQLEKVFKYYQNLGNKYDCIVPLSGGKDSTYTLYICRKKYNLKVLAVNYDNGFQTPEAIENMRKAVKDLGVAFVSFTDNWQQLKEVYRLYSERTGGDICCVCCLGVTATILRFAEFERVPLIVYGYSPKLETTPIFDGVRYCREKLFRAVVGKDLPEDYYENIVYDHLKRRSFFNPISLFDYLPYDKKTILHILKTKLGWKEAWHGEDKADCMVFPVTNYFKQKHYGIGRRTLKLAALVRDGQINREEALRLAHEEETPPDPDYIRQVLESIGSNRDEYESMLKRDRLRYVKPITKVDDFKPLIELNKKNVGSYEKAELLIKTIQPEIKRDRGEIELVDIKNKHMRIRYKGDCRGCYLSRQVMIDYLDTLLFKYIPELHGVDVIFPPFEQEAR